MLLGEAFVQITADLNPLRRDLRSARGDVTDFANHGEREVGKLGGVFGKVGTAAKGAFSGLVTGAGIAGFNAAMGVAGTVVGGVQNALFGLNNESEAARARINAFTKDAGQTGEILDMVRDRASKTPFAFAEMANAAGSLIPVGKQAGLSLEELMQTAEILGASNPLEGLEGASFSLREAMTGDFGSIIERFNLSRSSINQWKEEGVSNFEIVQRAMAEMGYDTDLVAAMGDTMAGRWSTFNDTLDTLKQRITAPLFDVLKEGLTFLQGWFDRNSDTISGWADRAGQAISGMARGAAALFQSDLLPALQQLIGTGQQIYQIFANRDFVGGGWLSEDGPITTGLFTIRDAFMALLPTIQSVVGFIRDHFGTIAVVVGGAVAAFATLSTVVPIITGVVATIGGMGAAVAAAGGPIAAIVALLGGPFTIAIAAVAAGVGLLTAAWVNNWGGIQEKVAAVWSFLQPILAQIGARLGEFAATVLPQLQQAWTAATTVIGNVIQTVSGVIQTAFAAINGWVQAHRTQIETVFRAAWDFIGGYVGTVMTVIINAVQAGTNLLSGNWSAAWENVKNIFRAAWEYLTGILPTFGQAILTFVTGTLLPGVVAGMQAVGRAFGTWLTETAIPFVRENLPPFLQAIVGFLTGTLIPGVQSAFQTVSRAFGSWLIESAIPFVRENLPPFLQAIVGFLTGTLIPGVQAAFQTVSRAFGSWLTETAIPFVRENLPPFLQAIVGFLTGTALPAISQALVTVGRAFGSFVTETAIPFLMQSLPQWLSALNSWVSGTALGQIRTTLVTVGERFGSWVVETAVPYLVQNLPQWLSALSNWITGTAIPNTTQTLATLAQRFGTWVVETAVPALQQGLPQWGSALLGFLQNTVTVQVGQALITLGQKFGTWVVETAVPYLQQHIPQWLSSLVGWLTGTALPAIGQGLVTIGQKFGTFIVETAVPYLMQNVPQWLSSLTGWLTGTALPAIAQGLVTIGQKFGTFVTETAVPFLQNNIPKWLSTLSDFMTQTALPAIVGLLVKVGQAFGDWVTEKAVPTLKTKIPEWLTALRDYLTQTALPAATTTMQNIGSTIVEKMVENAKSKLTQLGDGLKSAILAPFEAAAKGIPQAMSRVGEMIGNALRPAVTTLNSFGSGVVRIVNAIGSKFNAPQIGWDHITVPGLATGHGNWRGGAAIVGEAGRELVRDRGSWQLVDQPSLVPLSAGAIVLPNKVTEQLLRAGVPGFETGLNMDLFKDLFKGPEWLLEQAIKAIGLTPPKLPGALAAAGPAIFEKVKGWIVDWLKQFIAKVLPTRDDGTPAIPVGPENIQNMMRFAESQMGLPYIWGGGHGGGLGGPGVGFDCSGFVAAVLRAGGIPNPGGIVTTFYEWMRKGGKTGVLDIAINNPYDAPDIQHMGIGLMGTQYEFSGGMGKGVRNYTNFTHFGQPPGNLSRSMEEARAGGVDPALATWKNILKGDVVGQFNTTNSVPPMDTLFDYMERTPGLFNEENVMRIADVLPALANGGVVERPTVAMIGEAGREIVTPEPLLRSIVRDEAGKVLGTSEGMTAQIMPVIGDTGRMLAGPGADLMSGFMRGVTQQLPRVEKFFADLTESIPQWKGPKSRDLLLLYAAGQWVIEGFVNGMDSKILDVAKKAADVSQSVSKAIMDGVQALGALRTVVLPGGEQTSAFFEGLGGLVQGFVDAAANFEEKGLKSAVVYAEAAGKIVSMVKTGTEALSALVDFIRPSDDAIGDFKFAVEHLVKSFGDSAALMDVQFMAGAVIFSEAASEAIGVVKEGVTALGALVGFQRPTDDAIGGFKFAVEHLVRSFGDSAAVIDPQLLEHAKTFSQSVGAAVGVIETGVKGFAALATFTRPTNEAIGEFKFAVEHLVKSMGDSAALIDPAFLAHANTFNEAAGKAIAVLGTGVEAFAELHTFKAPTTDAIAAFKFAVEALVASLGDSARMFAADGLAQAGAYADTAGKMLAILKTGMEGLSSLREIPASANLAIASFAGNMADFVATMQASASAFDIEGVKSAATFAEAAGKILGIIKGGVDGLLALEQVPDNVTIQGISFASNMAEFVGLIETSSRAFSVEGVRVAAVFAEAGGRILSIIKGGVEGLSALADFAAPNRAAVDAFLASAVYVVDRLAASAIELATDGLKKVTDFANAAKTALEMAKSGGEAFVNIAKTTPPSKEAIDNFLSAVMYIVDRIGQVAQNMQTEGIAKIQAFATAAGTCLSTAKVGLEAFEKMAKVTPPSTKAMDDFLWAALYMIRKMGEAAQNMSREGIKQTADFADAAKRIFESAKTGLDALAALVKWTPPPKAAIDNLLGAMAYVISKMAEISRNIGAEGMTRAKDFARGADEIFTITKGGIDSLGKLAQSKGVATGAVDIIMQDLRAAVAKLNSAGQAGGAARDAEGIGRGIGDGIARGIRATGGNVSGAMGDIVNEAIARIKAQLGIKSPSTVLAREVGVPMGQGVIMGVSSTRRDLEQAFGALTDLSLRDSLTNFPGRLVRDRDLAGLMGPAESNAGGTRIVNYNVYPAREQLTARDLALEERKKVWLHGTGE